MRKILKALEMLAQRQFEHSNGLMFSETPLAGPKMTVLDGEMGELFIQHNRQYTFIRAGDVFQVKLCEGTVFNNEHAQDQVFCSECGYDQFEVMTVIRREALVFKQSIATLNMLSRDHLSTCLCCGRKIHVEVER
jgi:hypothetical protein